MNIPARFKKLNLCGAVVMLCGVVSAQAATNPTTVDPVTFDADACVYYGDFMSCSGQLLNQVNGYNAGAANYSPSVGPGQLQSNIVVGDNPGNNPVNDLINTDISPTGVDNGYQTYTGVTEGNFSTDTGALGGVADPTPSFTGDLENYWDIQLGVLQNFLTVGGTETSLVIGFDHNQTGDGDDQNLLSWAMVVISGDGLEDIVFELTGPGSSTLTAFESTKDLNSDPVEPTSFLDTGDFVVSNGQLCTAPGVFTSKADCEAAGGFWSDANKGNGVDYILTIPELLSMQAYLDLGYDVMHVRWDMRALNDGAETAFIMPGVRLPPPNGAPEPATLALLGLGLVGLGLARARKS